MGAESPRVCVRPRAAHTGLPGQGPSPRGAIAWDFKTWEATTGRDPSRLCKWMRGDG